MLKTIKDRWPLIAIAGVSALSIGMMVALIKATDPFRTPNLSLSPVLQSEENEASVVLKLVTQLPEIRREALNTIAKSDRTREGDRARYLLASDLIDQGQSGSALPLLDDLNQKSAGGYETMAPYILLKKGQAQAAANQAGAAQDTWRQLLKTYPNSGATAEALYQLGNQPAPTAITYWNKLLSEIPAHPRSIEIAFKQLFPTQPEANPETTNPETTSPEDKPKTSPKANKLTALDDLTLLKIVAYYGLSGSNSRSNYVVALDRLSQSYSSTLSPEDWAAIGFGYWETQNYEKAGEAYSKAPSTPMTLYRAARGQEIAGNAKAAIAFYQKLNQTFPEAPETATGLLNLANLLPRLPAITLLDQVMSRFPDQAAEALAFRADLLDELKSSESAQQARASLLSRYSDSVAAAEIRFTKAEASAAQGNYAAAINWAQQLIAAAPKADLAAKAGFLLGKWSLQQNQSDIAERAFKQVIREHPESYYAWRSAVHLDWQVGDFDTVRNFTPLIAFPSQRSLLPAGSATVQELHLLGQDVAAWGQWQTEFVNRQSPTVAEQFTDGILRLGVGDNLEGIFMVSSLAGRDRPAEKNEYQQIKTTPAYWQALYPFPFSGLILGWAQQRKINPLLVTALVRQESRFQADISSAVGATGLMQVMPDTANWIAEQTGDKAYTLNAPEDNVKLGTWYLDYTHREYSNNSLFAVASYNAGPGSVDGWIKKANFTNADEFVEKIPYPETRGYVESVFGGYWNYLRLYNPEVAAKIAAL